jgi:glycosyltransferase involved in cell wall biosynthesis
VELIAHQQSNGRAPKARNMGMRLAKGSIFAFLDSDDLWRKPYVSTLVRLFQEYPNAGLGFCAIAVIDPDDRFVKDRETGLPSHPREGLLPTPFHMILKHMPTQTSGVMVRRSVITDLGDFDLDLPVVEDWDLWYRISKKYDFVYTLDALACNREHPNNLPKYGVMALNSGLLMNLKHLPDVTDPQVHRMLVARIRHQQLLLREELLRTGQDAGPYEHLLRHTLAPRSARYMLGGAVAHLPRGIGKSYAQIIRWMGEKGRGR